MITKLRLLSKRIAARLKKLSEKWRLRELSTSWRGWSKDGIRLTSERLKERRAARREWIATGVQIVLAFLVGFYALETRKLRKHGELQLRYTVEPSILVNINNFNKPSMGYVDTILKVNTGGMKGKI
jgi:hypothetical protein